jgi:hypothetical protein
MTRAQPSGIDNIFDLVSLPGYNYMTPRNTRNDLYEIDSVNTAFPGRYSALYPSNGVYRLMKEELFEIIGHISDA